MTELVGGLRARLIRDSFFNYVKAGVVARGWTATGRTHKPFEFVSTPSDWDEEVPFNSIAISAEDVGGEDIELGSLLSEDTWTYYIDVFGDPNPNQMFAAMDVAHDIRDILRGKVPSVGAADPSFPVYDYRTSPNPPVLFRCEIENVIVDRARNFPQAWRRNWYAIRLDVLDTYATELG